MNDGALCWGKKKKKKEKDSMEPAPRKKRLRTSRSRKRTGVEEHGKRFATKVATVSDSKENKGHANTHPVPNHRTGKRSGPVVGDSRCRTEYPCKDVSRCSLER